MKISLNRLTHEYFIYFIPIIMFDYYLIMRGININTILLIPAFVLFIIKAVKIAIQHQHTRFITYLNAFVVYSIISGFFYAFNDAPFACFTSGFKFFLFPVVFAYLGYTDSSNNKFEKCYMYACLFCFLIGFYLYYNVPSYYSKYLLQVKDSSWNMDASSLDTDNVINFTRFGSFFSSSYAVQYFGIPALIMSLVYANKKSPNMNIWFIYAIAITSFVACILCQQRMAMSFSFLIPLILSIYYSKYGNFKLLKILILSIIIILLFGGVILSLEKFDFFREMIVLRFEKMNFWEALKDRTGQFESFGRMTTLSAIFGLGLGSCSTIAGSFGLDSVFDSEFPKIFYELGLVGIVMFLFVIIPTLLRGLKYFKFLHMELMIVAFFLTAGIGSDSLTFFIYDIIFWYSVGRIWNKAHLSNTIINNNIIKKKY